MRRLLIRIAAAIAIFVALGALRLNSHFPALPNPLTIDVGLELGEAGRSDPLIVAGRTGTGDFLSVRFLGPDTFHFLYDSWGFPGISSAPVTFKPSERLRLSIEMPALNNVHGNMTPPMDRVRVICDGTSVLDVAVHSYVREPDRIFFGENPLGGTACGTTLRGQIFSEHGQILRGRPAAYFSHRERLHEWLRTRPQQVASLLVLSIGLAFFGGRIRFLWSPVRHGVARALGPHRWFIGAATAATFCYLWIVTGGTLKLNQAEVFGSFYDYQAASLLQGRLDVPEDAIGGEAFESRGRLYGYFGPTPALLRMPFVLSGFAFGKLSRAFMVGYFVACLLASYRLLRHALQSGRDPNAPQDDAAPHPFATVTLVASVGLGSTIFFLGSRGFIFHEAILGGVAFALWSSWYALRHLAEPARRWWIGAAVCGVLSIHCRPPTGLFALTLLGCVSVILGVRDCRRNAWRLPASLRRHVGIAVLCGLGVLSVNGLAWLKFRDFDAAPLRLSRPYTGQPGRLERIDGKSFHVANLPFNFDTYILRPNFRIERGFPWIYLGSKKPRRDFPKAKIDLPDFTLGLPYAMPSLFFLATFGCGGAMIFLPRTRLSIVAVWAAVLPMSLALFAAVATAQRYTGDFCPFLVCAATFGLAAVELAAPSWRRLFRVLVALLTLCAVAVTVALTLHYQGETLWGVPETTRWNYQNLRRRVDGFFGLPVASPTTPPPPPRTDADF
jgi:hypothetical protein